MESGKKKDTEQKDRSWLVRLARESYEAELIVSGVAIFGVSLLPGLLYQLVDWVLLNISEPYFVYYYFVAIYLSFGIGIVYISLIFHFIARTLWIGLVGLHSVFPNGISFDKMDYLSEDYRTKMKNDLPGFQKFIEQLDHFCSMIFAFAFGIASIMVSIAIVIAFMLGLVGIVSFFYPPLPLQLSINVLLIILFIPMFISAIFSIKPLRENSWVQRFHYPMAKTLSQLLYNINYLPVTYIIGVFSSNYKLKKVGVAYLSTIILVGTFILSFMLRDSNILELSFYRDQVQGHRSDKIEFFEYEDQLKAKGTILTPIIPSDQISGSFMRLFVPLSQKIRNELDDHCGELQYEAKDLDRQKKREKRRAFFLNCIDRYFRLEIDDRPLTNVSWSYYTHPNAGERGVITYLPTKDWTEGKHILTILPVSQHKQEAQNVVFWFGKNL